MTIEQRAGSGSLAGVISIGLNLAQSIFLVPALLSSWTAESYGVWMAIGATVSLATSIDTGHQNYLGNLFHRQWIEDRRQLKLTVQSGMRAAVVIAVSELIITIGMFASGRFGGLFSASGSQAHGFAGAVTVNLLFWVLNGSIGGILVRLYAPAGLYAWGQWLGIGSRLSGFAALMAAVSFGASILGAMIAQVIAWSAFNIFIFNDLRRRFPEVHPWWRGGEWSVAWSNFYASLVLTLNGIVEQLAASGMILFVDRFLGPVQVAVFGTLRTVANIGLQGSGAVLNPLAPDFVRYRLDGDGGKITSVFVASWALTTSMLAFGLSVGVLLIQPLYQLWTRNSLQVDLHLFAFLGSAIVLRQWAAPFETYLVATNSLRPQMFIAVARAVFGLGIAFIFLPKLGLVAAGMGALGGEVAAVSIAWLAVRSDLNALGSGIPAMPVILGLSQVATVSIAWMLHAAYPNSSILSGCGGMLVAVILGCIQWKTMSVVVRTRMHSLAIRHVHRFFNLGNGSL